MYNINSGYGQQFGASNSGKVFILASASSPAFNALSQIFKPDSEGQIRLHTTWASVLAATVAGRGDKILVSRGFSTAPTLAQLATINTNGVVAEQFGGKQGNHYVTTRSAANLPATTATPYFTVTGKVRIIDIIGEVTTVVQNQACNTKLIANPTVGADVDICAVANIANDAVGTMYTITGTFATALQKSASGAIVAQAAPVVVAAGTIDLSTAATNTGATKWTVRWEPIDAGAAVIAA
jgi:hypothetical protein